VHAYQLGQFWIFAYKVSAMQKEKRLDLDEIQPLFVM